ncbi:type I restriction enzyme HsdR N-terminal domain-containing protein [Hymenobacter busanensis]|uniref:Type I restriction enzyme HsdR N-terminal domain-containing protein n=1 Tax=Hymenobacter busanensis TaxID=2607656 RepID=A0A7L4ZV38_9BACT|nr:type I restriction enzyme HsdR N-terminal domain-containing protein [Hymenobacter busanensis]KAA9339362.1 type I restriction enzyme HsdR N-terminal domain-containing protein [Hymenobacter busanensis]QHJ06877.1 restriction endonuclease subunit R [Hymenobacter busanensis]
MQALNLPPFAHKLTQSGPNLMIWDVLRRRQVVCTPEEWVRQHVVHYLVEYLGYPRGLLSLERGHTYNQRRKRTDLHALDPHGQPLLLVECKAATVPLTGDVAMQIATYNQTIGAPLLLATNGVQHCCWRVLPHENRTQQLSFIPTYAEALELLEVVRPA